VDRLTPAELARLVERFVNGTPKHHLAAEYGISESSVKRLLRKHRSNGTPSVT
jgi:DNA-binding transcriptional regulator LsrR (DeoR family)